MDVDVLNGLSVEDQVLYLGEHGYGLKGVFDGEVVVWIRCVFCVVMTR